MTSPEKSLLKSTLSKRTKVRTFVRIKPKENILTFNDNIVEFVNKTNRKFTFEFDRVFGPETTTEDIFQEFISDLKREDHVNMTILAYGQTGSGKTYTMAGERRNIKPGIINDTKSGIINDTRPVIINDTKPGIMQMIIELLIKKQNLKVSFIEVYNEKIFDGIDQKEKSLREHKEKFYIPDLIQRNINSMEEFNGMWDIFMKERRISETQLNMHSSRSHTITRIEANAFVVNLVDLAGSEDNKRTGNTGDRLKESQNINSSLFVLNKVVNSIMNSESRIPYRDSKLTRLLKESLGGIGVCFVIATVIDELDEAGLTRNTLNFASKTRQITTISRSIEKDITTIEKDITTIDKLSEKNIKNPYFTVKDRNKLEDSEFTTQSPMTVPNTLEMEIEKHSLPVKTLEINIKEPPVSNQKHSLSSSTMKSSYVSNRIEMTPITKQKSKECFINKAIEYEKADNFKMALDTYRTVNKISPSAEVENKITELSKRRKMAVAPANKMNTSTALHILNFGTFLEIKQLNGIGDKRAKIIFDFISGGSVFESLEDLKLLFNEKILWKVLSGICD